MPMKSLSPLAAAALAVAALAGVAAPAQATDADAAAGVAARFQSELKARLLAAMADGGPVAAVTVCRDEAPRIAARVSAESGWTVKRVGTRVRNPATGTPDAWEQAQLADMAIRLAAGEAADTLGRLAVVDGRQRLAAPILVGAPCLACHGDPASQPEALRAALRTSYPQDAATGYRAGELRGAVIVSRPLP
jgi:hypothetical protein